MKTALKSKNVVLPDGIKEATLIIDDGKIIEIKDHSYNPGCENVDCDELVIMPGLIDTHVHINEPGREHWEGFETATKSAAAGGITMLVDMPLNSLPVTTDRKSLDKKIEASKNKLFVDCGFYGGIVPGNEKEIESLFKGGVLGLKGFLVHSGIDDFPNVSEEDLRKALKEIKYVVNSEKKNQIPLLVHAELILKDKNVKPNVTGYRSFLENRPAQWENDAIKLLINLSREFDYHIHIVHLSSSEALDMIKQAKSEGLKITVETCPHYLFFSSEEIPDNNTLYKCTPPIRGNENREKLWKAVKDGLIDFIVSDHSPCDPELKCLDEGDFQKAWGGISSLQLGLSIVWTEARKRNFTLNDVSKLMSNNTALFAGLQNSKGKIQKGFDADLLIFNPEKKFIVEENLLFHKHKVSPYIGKELFGTIEATYLKGKRIFENGKIINGPEGEIVYRVS